MASIFAQVNNVNNANGPPDEFWFILGAVVCGVFLIWFVIRFFFTLAVIRVLQRCRPHNRTMEPGLMWLNLIPVVHIAWNFVTVIKVTESLRNEYADRGWRRHGDDYGNGIGMAMSVLDVASFIPYCGGLFGLAGLVCFIIYWVKVAGYAAQLARGSYRDDEDDEGDDYDDRYDDRDDDRPRRRRGRDDDHDDDDRRR